MPARDTRKTTGRNRSPVDSVNGEIKARQDAAVDVVFFVLSTPPTSDEDYAVEGDISLGPPPIH